VHYRWHPLHGETLRLLVGHRVREGGLVICLGSDGKRWVLPQWMLDPECAQYEVGAPLVSIQALRRLREQLSSVPIASGYDGSASIPSPQGVLDEAPTATGTAATELAAARADCSATARRAEPGLGSGTD